MNILLTAATELEIEPTVSVLRNAAHAWPNHQINTLITGVGMTQATFHLTKCCTQQAPDLIIQAGIAGTFKKEHTLGNVFVIENEYFGDLGVEENEIFHDLFDKNFLETDTPPFSQRALQNPHVAILNKIQLPHTNAISVNQITTQPKRIQQLEEKYNVTIESMEGISLHYVGLMLKTPFIQLRAVSNVVGERNKLNWDIPLAVKNVNARIIDLIESL